MMKYRQASFLLCLPIFLISCTDKFETPYPVEGITNTNLIQSNLTDYKKQNCLPSEGKQKLLVIPCQFEGEREFTDADLEKIGKAFFGDSLSNEENCTYSLSEFYERSSYGALDIEGEVTKVIDVPYTVEEVESDGNYFPGVPAYQFYYNHPEITDEYLRSFDQDKDGYIDSAVFVYSSPKSSRSGNFWAWCYNMSQEPSLTRPSFSRHMWVGIDFISQGGYEIDAHTIAHETGHLLGLADYYPTDNNNLALGGHSMMDYNISDHDPYSKMLLGWIDPKYYDYAKHKKIEVELEDFQKNGDCILLKSGWNHSSLDEYILLEYYRPTGLNAMDAAKKYDTRPLGFTESGIKVYHIDARVAKCLLNEDKSDAIFDSYVDEIPDSYGDDVYYMVGASNSIDESRTDASRKGRYKLISLLENKKYNNTLQMGIAADNDSLFQVGDVFDSSTSGYITDGRWNSGEEISFKMEVESIDSDKATLKITYGG